MNIGTIVAYITSAACKWHYGDSGVKAWFKRFLRGMYTACAILIVVGVTFIVFWTLITGTMIVVGWLAAVVPPTTNNIIIMLCIFFVVVFGLIWSTWN